MFLPHAGSHILCFVLETLQLERLTGGQARAERPWGQRGQAGQTGGQAPRGDPRHQGPTLHAPLGGRQEGEAGIPDQKHHGGGSGAAFMVEER